MTPKQTTARQASWDSGQQNSGLICDLPDHSGVLTPHGHDRYNSLIAQFGDKWKPALRYDDGITPTSTNTFIIEAGHYQKALLMNDWRLNPSHVPSQ